MSKEDVQRNMVKKTKYYLEGKVFQLYIYIYIYIWFCEQRGMDIKIIREDLELLRKPLHSLKEESYYKERKRKEKRRTEHVILYEIRLNTQKDHLYIAPCEEEGHNCKSKVSGTLAMKALKEASKVNF